MTCPFLKEAAVDRLQKFGFPPLCYPSYGPLTLAPAALSPAEDASLSLDTQAHMRLARCCCIITNSHPARPYFGPRDRLPLPGAQLMKILHVVGARPNFIKVAPVLRAFRPFPQIKQLLVHTGQHYDLRMSKVLFHDLGIPEPEVNLGVGSGSHVQQTVAIMTRFESIALENRPDMVIVYGDVNSAIAAALVCAKMLIPVTHVEAGLRSFDRAMPEEINRILTDQLSSLLLTPSIEANHNLLREGVPQARIELVGNVMIDSLVHLLPTATAKLRPDLPARYALVTMHRSGNVDDPRFLRTFWHALKEISRQLPVIFPIHPRTRRRATDFGVNLTSQAQLHLSEPVSYLDFLALQANATLVITDSGGVQEETIYLGVPCLTVRENTERPVTTTLGTNVLVGRSMERLHVEVKRALAGPRKLSTVPPLWDGHAAERIVTAVIKWQG